MRFKSCLISVDTRDVTELDARAPGIASVDERGQLAPEFEPAAELTSEPASEQHQATLETDARLALLDAAPVGLLLIDTSAKVRYANRRCEELMVAKRSSLIGRDVFDFVLAEDLDFVASLFVTADRFEAEVMGPSRMRVVDGNGNARWTQLWAYTAPPELGVEGFIVAMTKESVRDVLVTAVSSVAADDDLDPTLAAVATSTRAAPLEGIGTLLKVVDASADDADRFEIVGECPISASAINAYGTPWRQALAEGRDLDVDDVQSSDLAPQVRDQLVRAGVSALFVRLVRRLGDEIVGVLVVFRTVTGDASVNQDDHLDDAVRLASLAFAQHRRRDDLQAAARRDALTRALNRTAFMERLESELRAADVLFVDLDHFKAVNDTFGHEVGDEVLAEAARRIEAAVRRDDEVYRTGGDEFVVVCTPSGSDPATRIALAERVVGRLMAPFDVRGHRVRIGATVGIARSSEDGLADTVRLADAAMLTAKERGRAGWAHAR